MIQFLFDLSVAPPWLWLSFVIGILVLLIIDLSLFGENKGHKNKTKTALIESALWILIALIFNAWFAYQFGLKLGMEFLTGYLVEKSLSVDNLFIILLIFQSFQIPDRYQHRILFYGVLGAVVFRALFILIGAQLIHEFHWILYIFGGILVVTAIKFLIHSEKAADVHENWAVRLLRKVIPVTTHINSSRLLITENNKLKATPLLLALVVIESTDIVFAVDSIPAVFAVTQDAFVAFASNILAILGLRALYFVLADWISKLRYLKPGLATILGFIGIKMLLIDVFKIPSWVSLLAISSILTTAALSSWYVDRLKSQQ